MRECGVNLGPRDLGRPESPFLALHLAAGTIPEVARAMLQAGEADPFGLRLSGVTPGELARALSQRASATPLHGGQLTQDQSRWSIVPLAE